MSCNSNRWECGRTEVTTLVDAFERLSRKATKLRCEIGEERHRRQAVVNTVMNCHASQQAINSE
jgi:hypothetical protein